VLESQALAKDERFDKNFKRNEKRDELLSIIDACFSKFTTEQVIAKLDQAQIANARLNDMQGLWNHDQLKERERWVQVGSPVGPITAMLPPGSNNSFEYRMDDIPAVGQHTEAILSELGIAASEIELMRSQGAI
jgi:crotonobetainyl-CoA:carnitine CoA-transferase CaiB-like acyl-CoA transferase